MLCYRCDTGVKCVCVCVAVVLLAMVRGWWWIKEPEDLTATLQTLHPRGIREKVLHKHLAKHMEYLAEVCTRPINGESVSAGHRVRYRKRWGYE